jgi:hypothetical protein
MGNLGARHICALLACENLQKPQARSVQKSQKKTRAKIEQLTEVMGVKLVIPLQGKWEQKLDFFLLAGTAELHSSCAVQPLSVLKFRQLHSLGLDQQCQIRKYDKYPLQPHSLDKEQYKRLMDMSLDKSAKSNLLVLKSNGQWEEIFKRDGALCNGPHKCVPYKPGVDFAGSRLVR